MEQQPEINVELVGHVDHGKTTLTERLSGKWTDTHSEEIKKGITIRLGYADVIIKKCEKCGKYTTKEVCECGGNAKPERVISLVDAPGHESLMATMISGATIIDGALLIIAADEACPQPQTMEHMMALKIIGIKDIIVVQNKIDMVSKEDAVKNYQQIKLFLKDTPYENSPIIPVSAKYGLNIDVLLEAIQKYMPTPQRDPAKDPMMLVARSFDINRPGSLPSKMVGGVLGGALTQGIFKVGDEIELKPGRKVEKEGKTNWVPISTKIASLRTGDVSVKQVRPGGSIGLMTELDPSIVKSDQLVGNVVGQKGKLPPIWNDFELEVHLLERVVGVRDKVDVEPVKMSEALMLNVNSGTTVGVVAKLGKESVHCILKLPVCAEKGARVTISRRIGTRFRLIGYGIIK